MMSSNETCIAAVFQGGGAKGIAYSGVLEALEARSIRISRVAGASAGAITAALVARGLTPDQLRAEVPHGLATLAPYLDAGQKGVRAAVKLARQHRRFGAVFSTDDLEKWLRELIGGHPKAMTTFKELYEDSENPVELNVVCANVSASSQQVFNHVLTPDADVVLAVLASSAIPGAFPPGALISPVEATDGSASPGEYLGWNETGVADHSHLRDTLVDGGVWANYPDFVFKDRSFRSWAGMEPVDEPIVGFVLSRQQAVDPRRNSDGAFLVSTDEAIRYNRRESLSAGEPVKLRHSSGHIVLFALVMFAVTTGGVLLSESGVVRALFIVLAMAPAAFLVQCKAESRERIRRLDHPPWPVKSRVALWLDHLLTTLSTGQVLWIGLAVSPLVGSIAMIVLMVAVAATLGGTITVVVLGGCVAVLSVSFLISGVFASSLIWSARFAAPVIISSLPGTAQTLLSASTGVRPWIGADEGFERVLRVPYPPSVDTLTFDLDAATVDETHQKAALETSRFLDESFGL